MPGSLTLLGAGRQTAAAPAFSPDQITGLRLWLQADSGVWKDTARTVPATLDGDPVAGWTDLSGVGNHFTQATSAKRPTLKLAIRNGRSVLRCDGADDFMDAAAQVLSADDTWTVFYVHQTVGDNIWAGGDPAGAINCQLRVGQGGGLSLSAFDQSLNPISNVSAVPRTSWSVCTWQANSPNIFFWVAGVNVTNATPTLFPVTHKRFLSDFGGSAALVNGDVGEIIIYNTVLTTTERQNVEAYCTSRWAL